jgi:hypothetical protein
LPQNEVHFPNVRDVFHEFLVHHRRTQVRDIHKTHLGYAFVRFEHIYDRDNYIARSPHPYGDVTFTFVKHDEGRNWRMMEFNRQCWLMLLGFPLDLWYAEHVQSAIASFGRVIHWEEDHINLARMLVQARVTDLVNIPRHIVSS